MTTVFQNTSPGKDRATEYRHDMETGEEEKKRRGVFPLGWRTCHRAGQHSSVGESTKEASNSGSVAGGGEGRRQEQWTGRKETFFEGKKKHKKLIKAFLRGGNAGKNNLKQKRKGDRHQTAGMVKSYTRSIKKKRGKGERKREHLFYKTKTTFRARASEQTPFIDRGG